MHIMHTFFSLKWFFFYTTVIKAGEMSRCRRRSLRLVRITHSLTRSLRASNSLTLCCRFHSANLTCCQCLQRLLPKTSEQLHAGPLCANESSSAFPLVAPLTPLTSLNYHSFSLFFSPVCSGILLQMQPQFTVINKSSTCFFYFVQASECPEVWKSHFFLRSMKKLKWSCFLEAATHQTGVVCLRGGSAPTALRHPARSPCLQHKTSNTHWIFKKLYFSLFM